MTRWERFEAKVNRSGPGGCWLWTGAPVARGYGRIGFGKTGKGGTVMYAHRFSWELHNGPILDGLNVLHHCDNPPCVNPSHLFLGTQGDNVTDMVQKGRHKNSRKTECKRGHALTTGNIKINRRGARVCQPCIKIRYRSHV